MATFVRESSSGGASFASSRGFNTNQNSATQTPLLLYYSYPNEVISVHVTDEKLAISLEIMENPIKIKHAVTHTALSGAKSGLLNLPIGIVDLIRTGQSKPDPPEVKAEVWV